MNPNPKYRRVPAEFGPETRFELKLNGMFEPTNPAVKCPKGDPYTFADAPPKMVKP